MSMSQPRYQPPAGSRALGPLVLCCVTAFLLSACGWQPRGAFVTTDQLGKIYIDGMRNDPVGKTLKRDIIIAGGEITLSRVDADHIVWIGNSQTENRDASYDVLIRTVEKEIVIRVVTEVRSRADQLIYGPEVIYAERVYEYDVQGVTSTAAQVEVITKELKEDIGHQIAQRLSSLTPSEVEETTAAPGAAVQQSSPSAEVNGTDELSN